MSLFEGTCVPLLPAGKLNVGVTKVPFSLELRSTTGVEMVETYHGVHILASYLLKSVSNFVSPLFVLHILPSGLN